MSKRAWVTIALMAVGVTIFTASFPTTNISRSSWKNWAMVTSTGQVIGPTGELPVGAVFVSIGEVAAGSALSTFEIGSRDIGGTAVLDTFKLGNGVPFNERFDSGIDSLNVLALGSGANYLVGVSN